MQKILFAVAALFLAACNPLAQNDSADALIDDWHANWNAEDWEAIYNGSSDEFRAPSSLEEFSASLQAMRNVYGEAGESSQDGISIDVNDGVTRTTITRSTTFTNGVGIETFGFDGTGDDMELVGWHIEPENLGALLGTAARRSAEEARATENQGGAAEKPGASEQEVPEDVLADKPT